VAIIIIIFITAVFTGKYYRYCMAGNCTVMPPCACSINP